MTTPMLQQLTVGTVTLYRYHDYRTGRDVDWTVDEDAGIATIHAHPGSNIPDMVITLTAGYDRHYSKGQ